MAQTRVANFDQSPLAAIHYVGAELPAEDFLLLQPSLRIIDEFPDVRFVWTHRDPLVAIASL